MSPGRILGSQNGSGARAAALWGGLGAQRDGGTVGRRHLPSPQHNSSQADLLREGEGEGAVGLPASWAEQSVAGGRERWGGLGGAGWEVHAWAPRADVSAAHDWQAGRAAMPLIIKSLWWSEG